MTVVQYNKDKTRFFSHFASMSLTFWKLEQ